jgi:hypothetical protein
MTATLLPQGRQRYYDDLGFPLSGGKLYTYAAGTSTPQQAFQDADGTVPHTNPIVLDAKGEAVIYWLGNYKADLKSALDLQVTGWPVDNLRADPFGFGNSITAVYSDLASTLNLAKGASMIGRATQVVDTYTALRGLSKTSASKYAQTTGNASAGDGWGVEYRLDIADVTAADDGTTTIVATDGGRWKALAQRIFKKQDAAGWALQITKDVSPLDYANTRASAILQHRDTAAGAANELIPGAVFQFKATGDGVVNSGVELSQTIWQGLFSYMQKTGDGSAHTFTGIGELGAVGTGGYNELGLYQGELTNTGSALGTMSGVEMLLKDSPDAGVNTYSTKMQAVVGRIAKYNPTTRKSYHFYASSEGTQNTNAILGLNPNGNKFQRGFDFEGANFSSGQFGLAPNNTFLAWLTAGGTAKPIIGISATDNTIIAPAGAGNKVSITNSALQSRLEVDSGPSDAVLVFVGGALKRVGQGLVDSAGAGFRLLNVPN